MQCETSVVLEDASILGLGRCRNSRQYCGVKLGQAYHKPLEDHNLSPTLHRASQKSCLTRFSSIHHPDLQLGTAVLEREYRRFVADQRDECACGEP